jgi:hypothetical protein
MSTDTKELTPAQQALYAAMYRLRVAASILLDAVKDLDKVAGETTHE